MLSAFGESIKDDYVTVLALVLRQTCLDGPGHDPAEEIIAANGEVNVVGILHFGKVGGDRGKKVIKGDDYCLYSIVLKRAILDLFF